MPHSDASTFSDQQFNFEIKKMLAEINYLKEQVDALDVKSSLYADPFSVYNKEVILNLRYYQLIFILRK